ncbi:MAG: DPP IV N-terminal domain-containing protein, partial [Gemmatimonadaceae bacterium]
AAEPLTRERQIMEFFRVSPDGRTLVFDSDRGGRQHIYRMPIAGGAGGGAVQQLTSGEWDDFAPVWSHDGKSIAFHSSRTGDRDVYVVPAEGGTAQQLTASPEREWMVDWSRQGEQVAFVSGASLGLLTRSRSWAAPRLVETLTVRPGSPVRWSPDGSAIAFYSRDGLRVLKVGSPPSRVIVRAVSGAPQYLAWSEDGRTVYYESTDANQRRAIRAIPSAGGTSRPLVWFDDPGKQATRFTLDVNGGWLYLTLGDRQADVSVVDFSRR